MKKNLFKIICFCLAIVAITGGVIGIIEQSTYVRLLDTNICRTDTINLEFDNASLNKTNCIILANQTDTLNIRFTKMEIIAFFSTAAILIMLGCLGSKRK